MIFFDIIYDGGEVVIYENYVSCFFGNIFIGDIYGDIDVIFFERRGVVDVIIGDGDDFVVLLVVFDD